jgi:hypothetical protein
MTQIRLLDGAILLSGGSVAVDVACCCASCDCTGAPNLGLYQCRYSIAEYEPFADVVARTFDGSQVDITGSCTHKAVRDVTNSFDVCTPASCPSCPTGTYVVACNARYGKKRWDVVCENSTHWYVTFNMLEIICPSLNCVTSGGLVGDVCGVRISSKTFGYAKTGSLPADTGSGWIEYSPPTGFSTHAGNVWSKTWTNTAGGFDQYFEDISYGNCTAECAQVVCVPKYPNANLTTNTYQNGGTADGGCNMSGLTIALTLL